MFQKSQKIHRPSSVITTTYFINEECRHSHYNFTRKKFANNGCKQGLFVAVWSMFLGVQSLKDMYMLFEIKLQKKTMFALFNQATRVQTFCELYSLNKMHSTVLNKLKKGSIAK